jgi:probable rRNA maturation factor
MIEFEFLDLEIPGFDSEFFVSAITDLIHSENKKLGDITLLFCDDTHMLKMNKEHLSHDYYTDILTFDYCAGNTTSGELLISWDTVQSNALKYKVDKQTELKRVVFHGVLHLCGYNDKNKEEKQLMRSKENECLEKYVSRET